MKLKLSIGSFALLSALALFVTSREPEYRGRTLSTWLEDLDYGQVGYDRSKVPKAEDAVRHIGARAVPKLITMMRYRESLYREPFRVRVTRFFARQKVIKIKQPLPVQPPSAERLGAM